MIAYILRTEGEREISLVNQLQNTINGEQYPSLYSHKIHKNKKIKHSEFESETNSESYLETAQRPKVVNMPIDLSTD